MIWNIPFGIYARNSSRKVCFHMWLDARHDLLKLDDGLKTNRMKIKIVKDDVKHQNWYFLKDIFWKCNTSRIEINKKDKRK